MTTTIGCLGGELSGAFAPAIASGGLGSPEERLLELRLRLAYARPITGADRVTLRPGAWTQLSLGPNRVVGVAVDDRWLPRLFVGGTVCVRPFVTFHTGFFAELSFGATFFPGGPVCPPRFALPPTSRGGSVRPPRFALPPTSSRTSTRSRRPLIGSCSAGPTGSER